MSKKTSIQKRTPSSLHPDGSRVSESVFQEIERMKKLMKHYRRLTLPSRNFVLWLMERDKEKDLPEIKTPVL